MNDYHSYTEGNGPWHILGARVKRPRDIVFDPYNPRSLLSSGNRVDFRTDRVKCDESAYTDRLFQWDSESYERANEKIGKQPWWQRTPEEISVWLTEYYGKPTEFVALWQGNNASSGHPYWVVFFDWRK